MTKKEFQLCGLGNAIVDIFVEVSDPEFVPGYTAQSSWMQESRTVEGGCRW